MSTADGAANRFASRLTRASDVRLSVAVGAIALVFAAPLIYLLSQTSDALDAIRDADIGAPLARTVMLATTCAITTAILGTSLAWLIARTDLPGRRFWRIAAPLPLVFPSFVGAFCFLAAFTDGGLADDYLLRPLGIESRWRIEGFGWSVVVLTLFTYPYVYLPVVARLTELPASIEESARSLGCSTRRLFVAIVLPQIRGAIGAGALLVFLYSLSEFGAVSLLRYGTLTRSIHQSVQSFDEESAFALSLVLAACALAVISLERAWSRRRGRIEATGRGRVSIRYPLGRSRVPATIFVGAMSALALFGPMAVLAQWAWRGVRSGSSLHAERLLPSVSNTVQYGVIGAVCAIAITLPIAYLVVRRPANVIGRSANAIVTSAFAIPGLVLGFVFVDLALTDQVPEWLYQSSPLLVLAYVVHFGAQALRAGEVAVTGVPRRLGEASRSLGVSGLRRFLRVDLPLMRSGLGAGAGLVLLSVAKELPATLLLIPSGEGTLALRVWSATESLFYAQAGFFALALVTLSGGLTWFLTIRPLAREGRL